MMVSGLARRGSTMRWRIWPSVSRAALRRSGARLPWKRSSGNGPLWHSRQRPSWRLATSARPLAGSPLAPDRGFGIASCAAAMLEKNARTRAASLNSHHLQAVVLQRQRAVALAGGLGDRVQHRRRRDADGRLADAAPGVAAALDDDGL